MKLLILLFIPSFCVCQTYYDRTVQDVNIYNLTKTDTAISKRINADSIKLNVLRKSFDSLLNEVKTLTAIGVIRMDSLPAKTYQLSMDSTIANARDGYLTKYMGGLIKKQAVQIQELEERVYNRKGFFHRLFKWIGGIFS